MCRLQGTDRITLSLVWPIKIPQFMHPSWGSTQYVVNITAFYPTAPLPLLHARMSNLVHIGSDMSSFSFRWSTTRWMSAKLKSSHAVRLH